MHIVWCTCLEQQLLQARDAAPVFKVVCVHRLCTCGGYERLELLQELRQVLGSHLQPKARSLLSMQQRRFSDCRDSERQLLTRSYAQLSLAIDHLPYVRINARGTQQ